MLEKSLHEKQPLDRENGKSKYKIFHDRFELKRWTDTYGIIQVYENSLIEVTRYSFFN